MKRGRPRQYELRWTGNIKPNGQKELVRTALYLGPCKTCSEARECKVKEVK